MGLVLGILGKGPGKSWNFIGYDVGGGHNDAGADTRIVIKILYVYMKKSLAVGAPTWIP